MQEVKGVIDGDYNYANLRGDTGTKHYKSILIIRSIGVSCWLCVHLPIPLLCNRQRNKHSPSPTHFLRNLHGFHHCRFLHLLQIQSGT